MRKRYEWEQEIGDELKRYMKKMELPELKNEKLPLLPKDFELDQLKFKSLNALDPLGTKSFKLKEPLDLKEQHRKFVSRIKADMEQEMKMREQREFDAHKKQMDNMKLKEDTRRFLQTHFDNVARSLGKII